MNFGDYLYALRNQKGWTQQQLADLLGVTNKTVSKWERNEGYPSIDTLLSLSKLFNVTVDELLNGGSCGSKDSAMEILLQDWQSVKNKMISNLILFVGLLVFFGLYFFVHNFVISFFVFLVFALCSISLLIYRQEKLLHLMNKKKDKKEVLEWLCYLGICVSLLFPCTIGEFVTYTIMENFEVNTYITFKNYLIEWLPLCLTIALIFVMMHKIIKDNLYAQIKNRLKRIMIVYVTAVLAFAIFFGLIPKIRVYSDSQYTQMKANYLSLVDSFDGKAYKPSTLNPHFEGKKVYEKYIDLIGCIDVTHTFVYRRAIHNVSGFLNSLKLGFIVSTLVSGCYLFYRKKEKNDEIEGV